MEKRKNTRDILLARYKRKSFCIVQLQGMKVDLFWESQAQKIVGRLRRTIHIDRKTESFWQKTMLCVWWDQRDMVYYELLKPGETVNT